ncbi:MAG: RNA 2',3'-cyclic phosphodiesterase [Pseudomonadota bacterium]
MRSFLGIELPNPVADHLAEIAERCPTGRSVPAENLHLTLCFLDDVPHETLEGLNETLAALRQPAFSFRIDGLGVFGGRTPRALYAGVPPIAALSDLNKRVRSKARSVGIALDHKQFVPHITLVRFRRGTEETAEFQRYVAAHAGLTLGPVDVTSFTLFASHLGKGGAHYEALARYPLE